ncbi:hypothetical protein FHG87_014469, partial [Trinorchestia longiramus]
DFEKQTFVFDTGSKKSKSSGCNINQVDLGLHLTTSPSSYVTEGDSAPEDDSAAAASEEVNLDNESCEVVVDESEDNTDASSTNTVQKCTGYARSAAVHISFELSDDKGKTCECEPDTVIEKGRRVASLGESRTLGPSFFSKSADSYSSHPS